MNCKNIYLMWKLLFYYWLVFIYMFYCELSAWSNVCATCFTSPRNEFRWLMIFLIALILFLCPLPWCYEANANSLSFLGSTYTTQPVSTPVAEGDDLRTPAILRFQVKTMEWDFPSGGGKVIVTVNDNVCDAATHSTGTNWRVAGGMD
jgi:hypothetical protein